MSSGASKAAGPGYPVAFSTPAGQSHHGGLACGWIMAVTRCSWWFFGTLCFAVNIASAAENVMLLDVPDYAWHAGCFGTATGNLIGYWDRHGFPNMYTGPTGRGLAPLTSDGQNAGIRSLWASQAGLDGRPANQPGHVDDYWPTADALSSFESTAPDPYVLAGRPEHEPDCLGDFIGQSQNKWSDLNGECSGNIDGFAFVYWDHDGHRRINFTPPPEGETEVRDIPSGLRRWSEYRGYAAEVASQLTDFNPTVPAGRGFTFENLKTEIDAGYPVLLILQNFQELSRPLPGMPRANPSVHAMVAYGYVTTDGGQAAVRYRTSWASGPNSFSLWGPQIWEAALPLRGVITYRPAPKITSVRPINGKIEIQWDGPSSTWMNNLSGGSIFAHWYVVERAPSLGGSGNFSPVTDPSPELRATIAENSSGNAFFRVRLMTPEEAGQTRE